MEITETVAGDVRVVALAGEMGQSGSEMFDRAMEAVLREGTTRVVLNLSRLTYVNHPGFFYLFMAQRKLRDTGGDLVLSEPSEFMRATLPVFGPDMPFRVFESDDEAVRSFRV